MVSQPQKPNNVTTRRKFFDPRINNDLAGRFVFLALLILIPVGTGIAIIYISWFSDYKAPTNIPPSAYGTLGAFDPSLGDAGRFVIGIVIFVLAAIVECSLFLVYGAFYNNEPANSDEPLGLARGTVRIFLLIMIVFVLILFALLPNAWGENKAVVLLFGILSTVVGFYFGANSVQEANSNPPPLQIKGQPALNTEGEVIGQTVTVTNQPANQSATATETPPAEPVVNQSVNPE